MSETAPAASCSLLPAVMEKPPARRRVKKPSGPADAHKARGFSVSKLIPEVLSGAQERAGMSLAALKKALAAAGYDVEKNNGRIKQAVKSLVSKGVLVQTKGTGASGSFRLSKKAVPGSAKAKLKKPGKAKKLGLSRDARGPKSPKTKGVKKSKATAKKAAGSGRQARGAKAGQRRKSPAKTRAATPRAGKPKAAALQKNPRKAAGKK